jgi:hypothetical protein
MKYPKWVPAGVVQMSSAVIQELDRELADLDAKLEAGRLSGRDLFNAVSRRGRLIEERERIERLATDFRMKEAYTLLGPLDDETWRALFYGVLGARAGLSEFRQAEGDEPEAEGDEPEVVKGELRKRMDDARRLSRRIAGTARELSRQIEELRSLGFLGVPCELVEARALFERADVSCPYSAPEWERLRPRLLGNASDLNDELRPAWESAPCVTDLLHTIAKAAEAFEPRPRKAAAALRSRKAEPVTELIRSIAEMLTIYIGIELTPRVKRAIAIIVTVDIYDPDTIVTYDDVRKACTKRKSGRVVELFRPLHWTTSPIPPSPEGS